MLMRNHVTALAATTPIYVQEVCVVGKKRTVDTMLMVFWGIGGISAATWFDYAMLKAPNHGAWRVALAMQALFLLIALVLVVGCPDSPRCVPTGTLIYHSRLTDEYRWLFTRGKEAEGTEALKRLLGAEEDDERLLAIRQDIHHSIELEREQTKKLSIKVLFTGDGSPTKNVRRIW
jgi:hypothetical protein